ncbi:MAG: DJ-1/PfpI family protein [Tannerella sp.]|jgi:4-methyl-5(b-hydroxyethyl)-thiazole monophosphate biosynthesis|nr:DJ-1/PfpI family protein [Tannerella sp.]
MKALVFLATGFEEIEAVGTIDILRRGDIETVTVSVTEEKTVTGAHGIPVTADALFENIDYADYDALILPGGGPGSLALKNHEGLRAAVADHYGKGKLIAAICAAPRVFGSLGLLKGKKATCYPGFEAELTEAVIVDSAVVTDHNVITGRGPGFVFDFGFAILNYLTGNTCATDDVAEGMLLPLR